MVLLRAPARPSGRVEVPADQVVVARTGTARDPSGRLLAVARLHRFGFPVLLHQQRRLDAHLLRHLRVRLALVLPAVPRHLHLAGEHFENRNR